MHKKHQDILAYITIDIQAKMSYNIIKTICLTISTVHGLTQIGGQKSTLGGVPPVNAAVEGSKAPQTVNNRKG